MSCQGMSSPLSWPRWNLCSRALQQLFGAIHGNQEAMDGSPRVNAGVTSPAEFFSEDHVAGIFAMPTDAIGIRQKRPEFAQSADGSFHLIPRGAFQARLGKSCCKRDFMGVRRRLSEARSSWVARN